MTDYASGAKLSSAKECLRDVEVLLPLVGTWVHSSEFGTRKHQCLTAKSAIDLYTLHSNRGTS